LPQIHGGGVGAGAGAGATTAVAGESTPNTGNAGITGTTGTADGTGSTGESLPLRLRRVAAGQPVAVRQLRREEPGSPSPGGSPVDSPRLSPADETDGPFLGSFSRSERLLSGSSGPRSRPRPLSPPPPPALLPHAVSTAATSSDLFSPSPSALGPPSLAAVAPGASADGSRAEVARQLVLWHSEQRAPTWQSLQRFAAPGEGRSTAIAAGGQPTATRPASVAALHLGAWRFKGAPSAVAMAAVALEPLAGRGFPADAPAGKGQRLEERSGTLGAAVVLLPEQLPPAPRVQAAAAAAAAGPPPVSPLLLPPAAWCSVPWYRRRPPGLLPR
jgi:hypothetical protein